MPKAKRKVYTVSAYIKLIVERTVTANSLAEALEIAGTMARDEFVEVTGELQDATFAIQGITDPQAWSDLN